MDVTEFEKNIKVLTARERIFNFLQGHPNEIFELYDEGLAEILGIPENTIAYYLGELSKEGVIGKLKDANRAYYAKKETVEELKKKHPGLK